MMINKMLALRNAWDFKFRKWIRWSRKGLKLPNEPKMNAFIHLPSGQKAQAKAIEMRLLKAYDLQDIVNRGDVENYLINLYYLEMIEKVFNNLQVRLPGKIEAADIGCSSWFYVRGYYSFLNGWQTAHGKRSVSLIGYEVDAYRPYLNLYTRQDYALAYSQNLSGTAFVSEAFKQQEGKFDLVSQFFPFIFIKDHLEWGLPENTYHPKSLVREAWSSLKSNGILLIVNQGVEEHMAQKELCRQVGIDINTNFKVESVLYKYGIDHYVIGAVKNE
jgi:hypothetical protein